MAIPSSTEPRYRYHEEAPEKITLSVAELTARLPAENLHHQGNGDLQGRTLELPCQEIFRGNTPRLPLGMLRDLLPDLVRIPEGTDPGRSLALPAGWLALHYRLSTRREELPPEPGAEPRREAEALSPEGPGESTDSHPEGDIKKETQPEPPKQPDHHAGGTIEPESAQGIPEGKASSAAETPETVVVEKKRGFFASLPIFRRHERVPAVVEESTDAPLPLTRELSSVPPAYVPGKPAEIKEADSPRTKETALVLERLWKLDPQDQLADPTALQALFMTEEKLTLERVLVLAGQLPGLRACVLAHGDQVVCSSTNPGGIDLRNLSAQATTMLSQIKESSAKMGLGSIPAVTLHAEQGVMSFLYQGELCLLVLHADRGFVPGVRERLAEMLGHLSSAKALPEGSSAQPNLPI